MEIKMEEKSIMEMARGAIMERADYLMTKIIEDLRDPNTDVKAARELHIVMQFKTDSNRSGVYMTCVPKPPKLASTHPITTTMYMTVGETGEVSVVELAPQIQGQMSMDGPEQTAPAKLRLIGGM